MPLFDEHTLARLRRLRLSAGRVQRGGPRGERLARQFGAGQEFGAHRPYAQGDDLRRVDWNVYGRLGQMFLKLFEAPGQLRVLLVADDAPTMDFGAANKWLAARRVLGAVGLIALEGAERVLLARLSETRGEVFDGTGETRLLDTLERMPAAADSRPQQGLSSYLFGSRARDSVLVFVSDFQERERALSLLSDARRSGVRAVAVSVACSEEINPTLDGFTKLQAVAGGETRLRVDARVLQAYVEELRSYREGIARAVAALGAAFIELDSADAVEPLILELMRAGVLGK